MSLSMIARRLLPTLGTKVTRSAASAEATELRRAGRDQLQASVLKRIAQHPDRAEELRALAEKLGSLNPAAPASFKFAGGFQPRLWMLPELSPGQRTLLHDTRPGSPANQLIAGLVRP